MHHLANLKIGVFLQYFWGNTASTTSFLWLVTWTRGGVIHFIFILADGGKFNIMVTALAINCIVFVGVLPVIVKVK